jgi:CHASE2 domain-containing sensor protein
LLLVGVDAYTLLKTGDIEWDDNIHDELLEALDKKGLQPVTDIEFDCEMMQG